MERASTLARRPGLLSAWLALFLAAAFAVLVHGHVLGARATVVVDDLATAAAALLAAALCARAAARSLAAMTRFWTLLALATSAWAVGEAVWAAYDLSHGSVPAVSWADVGYLAAVPATVAALLAHPARHGRGTERTRDILDALIVAASLFFVCWTLLLEPVRGSIDVLSRNGAVTVAYPIGDVAVVFLIVLLIRGTTRGTRGDLWWLLAGLLLMTSSDAVYFYLSNAKHFATGTTIDTGWFAGYLLIGLAALHTVGRPTAAVPQHAVPSLTPAALAAPFVPMLAALFLLAVDLQLDVTMSRTTLVTAVFLVGLVLARQILVAVDLRTRAPGERARDRLVASLGHAVGDPRLRPSKVAE